MSFKINLQQSMVFFCIIAGVSCAGCAQQSPKEKIKLTLEELKKYNGLNGQPTYVAIDGDIYDISKCYYWKNGTHPKSEGRAFGGRDLTEVLKNSKHGMSRLKKYPIVGQLLGGT